MTEEKRSSDELTPEAPEPTEAKARTPRGKGVTHWLVAAGAIASILFVAALWTIKGGSLDAFKFTSPEVAAIAPSATPAATAPNWTMAPASASTQDQVPVSPTMSAPVQGSAGAVTGTPQPMVPVAITSNGMPVFAAPHGAINPLTMMHDPRYYRQWGQVGATFVNPFTYQHIMNQMMLNSMQAWGLSQPITVSATTTTDPQS